MGKGMPGKSGASNQVEVARKNRARHADHLPAIRARILNVISGARILDRNLARDLVREQQQLDHDRYHEVWEGVYVVPPIARNPHQGLVASLSAILFNVVTLEGRGKVYPGANVSDRRSGWEHNYRIPDVVVVLNGGRAVDCTTHWMGGPDFLIEIESPDDETEEKIPFYSQLQVRELLVIHSETRQLRLYGHDGRLLVPIGPVPFHGGKWLVGKVIPMAFRRKRVKGAPRTEVQRADGKTESWMV